MAIQKDLLESDFGVGFQNSYFRITFVQFRKFDMQLLIQVQGYILKPSDPQQREVFNQTYFAPFADVAAQDGADFLAQCYNWLHAQPDFAGGIEV